MLFVLIECFLFQASGSDFTSKTMDEVRRDFERWRTSIHTVWMKCDTKGAVDGAASHVQLTRREIGVDGLMRYHEVIHFKEPNGWKWDRSANQVVLMPGKLNIHWIVDRVTVRSNSDANPFRNNKLHGVYNEFFMLCSGWWPIIENELSESESVDWKPPSSAVHRILSHESCVCNSTSEVERGIDCLVVECECDGRFERLWLDPSRSCIVIRRNSRFRQGHVEINYENSDWREYNGIWFPWKMERKILDSIDANLDKEIVAWTFRTVSDLKINESINELFVDPAQYPGIIERNQDRDESAVIPGGIAILDDLGDFALSNIEKTKHSQPDPFWSILVLGLVVLCVISFILTRKVMLGYRITGQIDDFT